jgi:hypothetical protein
MAAGPWDFFSKWSGPGQKTGCFADRPLNNESNQITFFPDFCKEAASTVWAILQIVKDNQFLRSSMFKYGGRPACVLSVNSAILIKIAVDGVDGEEEFFGTDWLVQPELFS